MPSFSAATSYKYSAQDNIITIIFFFSPFTSSNPIVINPQRPLCRDTTHTQSPITYSSAKTGAFNKRTTILSERRRMLCTGALDYQFKTSSFPRYRLSSSGTHCAQWIQLLRRHAFYTEYVQ